MIDLTTLTDEEFAEHRRAVLDEGERRDRLRNIPQQVADLAAAYTSGGGELSELEDALTTPPNAQDLATDALLPAGAVEPEPAAAEQLDYLDEEN